MFRVIIAIPVALNNLLCKARFSNSVAQRCYESVVTVAGIVGSLLLQQPMPADTVSMHIVCSLCFVVFNCNALSLVTAV